MTHLAKNPNCDACAKAKVQRKQKRKKAVVIDTDTIPRKTPVKFGGQVTADHLIKNDDEEEDSDIPINTVAEVMLDRATQWIAACPKASKTAEHTIEALSILLGQQTRLPASTVTTRPSCLQPLARASGELQLPPQGSHRLTVWWKGRHGPSRKVVVAGFTQLGDPTQESIFIQEHRHGRRRFKLQSPTWK